jgi:hypothetical protein
MCILIHHNPTTQFSIDHIQDFYSHNSDGFGAIVHRPEGVKVIKTIGALDEIFELYTNEVKGHEAIIHFRMKTHGDIDLINCHPYQVTDDIWMAHNGILNTGNQADVTKSDTWHYIQDYLRPMLSAHPELLHEPAFQKLVSSHIGYSNKFGFMDRGGKVVIINRQSGVDHLDAWLSNTYAWTPSKWGFYTTPRTQVSSSKYYNAGRYDYEDYWTGGGWGKPSEQKSLPFTKEDGKAKSKKSAKALDSKPVEAKQLSTEALGKIIRSCYNAQQRNAWHGILDWVVLNPMKAMYLIRDFYPDFYEASEISDLVNADPEQAADVIETIWQECEEDLLALAGIPFTPKNGDEYAKLNFLS